MTFIIFYYFGVGYHERDSEGKVREKKWTHKHVENYNSFILFKTPLAFDVAFEMFEMTTGSDIYPCFVVTLSIAMEYIGPQFTRR